LFNIYDKIKSHPDYYRQLRCGDSLISLFNCPLKNKYEDAWSHFNYFIYVMEGRKIWHTAHGSYDLHKGRCVFVRKGACIVEQFLETASCFIFFFMPDDFICEVLQSKATPVSKSGRRFHPIIVIDDNALVQAFFISMLPYFTSERQPDQALLELKFKELVLTIADNVANEDLHSYFCSLLQQPQAVTLQQVMEDNFCFNLRMEKFAQLSMRSLSAFKRDFQQLYQTSPGKWLLEKRLNHALHLLTNTGKTVSEAAFESGFESGSHFSRAFRQRFGTSPATIRQQATI
jgi:AraC family transcriptional regulator, exoenzyme S synthesis regulatory protein ExsA